MLDKKEYFKIIQITDTHLFKDDSSRMFDTACNAHFYNVINKIKTDEIEDADAIFLTGDLSQDESQESYLKLATIISSLGKPVYWIPGNHDSIEMMDKTFSSFNTFIKARRLSTKNWEFIFINSKVKDSENGFISPDEMRSLLNELDKTQKKQTAIVVHHHPAKVGTPLMDEYILNNGAEFLDAITDYNVKLVICGHVHGDYNFKYNLIHIETSPATCLQWEKGATTLSPDKRIGFKVYYFRDTTYESEAKLWHY